MDGELFSLLLSGGPFGVAAAGMFYLWQKSEKRVSELTERIETLRDAYELKAEANTKALLDQTDKRLNDNLRVEAALSSNTATMAALVPPLQMIASRGAP